jgi:hypothetical protein
MRYPPNARVGFGHVVVSRACRSGILVNTGAVPAANGRCTDFGWDKSGRAERGIDANAVHLSSAIGVSCLADGAKCDYRRLHPEGDGPSPRYSVVKGWFRVCSASWCMRQAVFLARRGSLPGWAATVSWRSASSRVWRPGTGVSGQGCCIQPWSMRFRSHGSVSGGVIATCGSIGSIPVTGTCGLRSRLLTSVTGWCGSSGFSMAVPMTRWRFSSSPTG